MGKDVPWEAIQQEACRVKHWTLLATIEGEKVKAFSKGMPYALLRVESPLLPDEALMPVVHRVDFVNTWEIFKRRGVGEEEEVLVIYAPSSGVLSAFKPRLHFYIHLKGHLEEIYDPAFKPTDTRAWFRPIAEWHPKGWRG